jgi:Holliday junction resolvasome RuvABC endonuclease subunit
MKILSLDLGSKTGWALRGIGGHISSGEKEFKADRFEGGGMRYLKFKNWLSALKEQAGGLDLVTFEEVRNHAGVTAAHLYGGFLASLTTWCEVEKIPYQGVPVATIKKHATGKGNAGKGEMITAMIKKGHTHLRVKTNNKGKETGDDNEADALAILYYSIEQLGSKAKDQPRHRVRIIKQ